ncbi:hypothetical protein ANO14919_134550 [Xylariales sp. No.14919]|nr:hypothetical protein ANO14919_134550 [Xylariales sp. No.14919]
MRSHRAGIEVVDLMSERPNRYLMVPGRESSGLAARSAERTLAAGWTVYVVVNSAGAVEGVRVPHFIAEPLIFEDSLLAASSSSTPTSTSSSSSSTTSTSTPTPTPTTQENTDSNYENYEGRSSDRSGESPWASGGDRTSSSSGKSSRLDSIIKDRNNPCVNGNSSDVNPPDSTDSDWTGGYDESEDQTSDSEWTPDGHCEDSDDPYDDEF